MTERDSEGKFMSSDPLRRGLAEIEARNKKLLGQFFRNEEVESAEEDDAATPNPGSFDGGANLGGTPAGPRPDMNTALQEAFGEHRAGARNVTIEVHPDRIERY